MAEVETFENIFSLYRKCQKNGVWAKIELETKEGKEKIIFSSDTRSVNITNRPTRSKRSSYIDKPGQERRESWLDTDTSGVSSCETASIKDGSNMSAFDMDKEDIYEIEQYSSDDTIKLEERKESNKEIGAKKAEVIDDDDDDDDDSAQACKSEQNKAASNLTVIDIGSIEKVNDLGCSSSDDGSSDVDEETSTKEKANCTQKNTEKSEELENMLPVSFARKYSLTNYFDETLKREKSKETDAKQLGEPSARLHTAGRLRRLSSRGEGSFFGGMSNSVGELLGRHRESNVELKEMLANKDNFVIDLHNRKSMSTIAKCAGQFHIHKINFDKLETFFCEHQKKTIMMRIPGTDKFVVSATVQFHNIKAAPPMKTSRSYSLY